MKKVTKRTLMSIASCMVSAIMCFGALAACGGKEEPGGTPATPEHVTAVPATCYALGNKEYWTLNGKYYSDEACTQEIDLQDTVVPKRSHDFGANASYDKDTEGHHWKVCAYEDCDGKDAAVAHHFEDGVCVCGATTTVTYTVTVATGIVGGTVVVTNVKQRYEAGEKVVLSATPDEGYYLATLVYNDGETDHDIKESKLFDMPAHDVTVKATFAKLTYAVTVASGISNGTVTVDKANATIGDTVTVTATPDGGYELVPGSLKYNDGTDHVITGNTFTMPAHIVEVSAEFRLITVKYDVTVDSAIEHGTVTVTGTVEGKAAAGDKITVTVDPEKGYHLVADSLKQNMTVITKDQQDEYTFTMPADAVEITAEFEEHTFNNGECEGCGKTNGFENYSFEQNNADISASRRDTEDSVIISRSEESTADNVEDWHIKLTSSINVKRGHFYEVTYAITSNKEGIIKFESQGNSSKYYNGEEYGAPFTLVNGDNTATFRFAPGGDGDVDAVLKLGLLPKGFEIEVTNFSIAEITTDLRPYTLGRDGEVTASRNPANDYNEETTEFTITASGVSGSLDWHLKVNQHLAMENGKTYEMTYVFISDKDGNTSFNVDKSVTYLGKEPAGTDSNRWNWVTVGVNIVTLRFTANFDDDNIYTCFQLGELTKNGEVNLTFTYIEFKEV
ncbi:MAG: hypothetical protein J1G04_01850 [Clostridiales bacterium]|nr:hypothetical protein [Clostridiales bacterium]